MNLAFKIFCRGYGEILLLSNFCSYVKEYKYAFY
jgi:hypothetical protein